MRSYDVKDIKVLIKLITGLTSYLEDMANHTSLELDSDGRSMTDLRRTAVKDIATTMLLFRLQYIYISECLLDYKWWDEHGFANLTPEQKMENASRYAQSTSFSAFHQAYSIYEGCLRQIHYSLDPIGLNQSTDGIYRIFKALIPKLRAPFYVRQVEELHIFLGLIRNTIHNNGCYRNVNKPIKEVIYKGTNYRFEHLKPVLFLYPEMLPLIMYDMGLALTFLMRDPIVRELADVRNIYQDNLTS